MYRQLGERMGAMTYLLDKTPGGLLVGVQNRLSADAETHEDDGQQDHEVYHVLHHFTHHGDQGTCEKLFRINFS